MTDSPIVHFDISAPNEESLHRFYSELFGWAVHRQGPGYALVETPGGLRGSIVDAEASQVTLGVGVDDLDDALARAAELGGTVVMPATDNGWVVKGQVQDPDGNVLTLIQK